MAVCDKWVALKIGEFVFCVACLIAKRVASDDEARLALYLQKQSREWSLLTSITWGYLGNAFADATYGGYTMITLGLLLGRVYREVPKGRRILETFFLGFGLLFFLFLGGLELSSLDAIPYSLKGNAIVLGTLSLIVAGLFLIDLMGPKPYTETHFSQTDPISSPKSEKKVSIIAPPITNGHLPNDKQNSFIASEKLKDFNSQFPSDKSKVVNGKTTPERPKELDLESNKISKKEETRLFQEPKHGYSKFDDTLETDVLEKSKYGSLRSDVEGGNYVRLSDPLADIDRFHYEQELAKFNEKYFRMYFDSIGKLSVREDYLPEPQTPVFSKVKSGRPKDLYDDMSPNYEEKQSSVSPIRAKTVPTPTLQQLEGYLRGLSKSKRADTPALFPMEPIDEKDKDSIDGRASGTPTDRGYVQYAANKWPDKRELRTPRHSPT